MVLINRFPPAIHSLQFQAKKGLGKIVSNICIKHPKVVKGLKYISPVIKTTTGVISGFVGGGPAGSVLGGLAGLESGLQDLVLLEIVNNSIGNRDIKEWVSERATNFVSKYCPNTPKEKIQDRVEFFQDIFEISATSKVYSRIKNIPQPLKEIDSKFFGNKSTIGKLDVGKCSNKVGNSLKDGSNNLKSTFKNFLSDPKETNNFAKEIIKLNQGTEGLGTIINSHPSSILNTASYYTKPIDQASSIFKGIIKNHIFIDGNKRTAIDVVTSFCKRNNLPVKLSNNELRKLAFKIEKNLVSDVSEISKILIKEN